MNDLYYLLKVLSVPGVGNQRVRKLVQKFGTAKSVLDSDIPELCRVDFIDEKTARNIKTEANAQFAEKQLADAEKSGIRLISIWDSGYPEILKKIHDPPVLLFIKGNGHFMEDRSIAMVGMRSPSSYGRRMAGMIAGELANRGIHVVSGMARGIDTCAHRGALNAGGSTTAILGCGVNVIYPPENIKLYQEIQQQGMIVSEFPIDEQPLAGHFPRRNRIISGLSLGTVVIEAGEKSGALITAYMALEQGREVFALPGQVGQKNSQGPHRLIKEGAKLIEGIEDIIEELSIFTIEKDQTRQEQILDSLSAGEKHIWQMLSAEPKHIDLITEECNLSTSEALAHLLSMELKNCVSQMSGMMFVRQ